TDINSSIIKFLKRNNLNFTLINQLEKYTIANALLKLGLKKGAIPWKINFIDHEDFNHIFIGVDLGHDHSHRSSNLTIIAINNQGLLLSKYQKLNLPISENIPLIELRQALKKIFNQIPERLKQNLKMTIHRDGNFHELSSFQEVMLELGIKEYNLVEVIKSDVPIIGFREQNHSNYIDGFTGYYLYKDFLTYLVTNDQSLKQGTSPSPLKIKKIIGYKSIHQIVEEIFWLTKAYSINIFESTKLPITTLLANNFAYTRSLIHFTN
ncbi:MAG: Piwi domain-containing protein, partial [Pseudanabaena sp.]